MFKWLKKHFIPHVGNDHRPHFLHGANARRLVLSVLFLAPTLNFSGIVNYFNLSSVITSVLTSLTNEERQNLRLSTLEINPLLSEAARLKAGDMAAKSYFAHTSPEGFTPWHWLQQTGYEYAYAGENLAINFTDSQDVTQAWMDSPSHRANIVMAGYTEIGTGVAIGMFEGKETVFVAQFYGNPKAATATIEIDDLAPSASPPVISSGETSEAATYSKLGQAEILGAETATKPSILGKIAVSSRHTTNIIFLIIGGVVALALLLNIFIKVNVQHPDLITNGLVVLVIIFGIYVANSYISKNPVLLTSFTAFDREETSLNF